MEVAASPGWMRRPRQFTLPSAAGQIEGRPAVVPLPARQGYHIGITVNYDHRQVAEPWVASVAGPIILPPQCSRRDAWIMLGVICESRQRILRNVVQGNEWFDLSVSGGSVPDGDFARHWCETVIGSASRPVTQDGNGTLMRVMDQTRSRSTSWQESKGADET